MRKARACLFVVWRGLGHAFRGVRNGTGNCFKTGTGMEWNGIKNDRGDSLQASVQCSLGSATVKGAGSFQLNGHKLGPGNQLQSSKACPSQHSSLPQ